MIYIIIIIAAVFFLYGLLIYIRKTMWDAVHRNLLDLEDRIDGRVIRRGFATRPFFHGRMNGSSFTINFSTEKKEGKRNTYIDFSYEKASKITYTISDKSWLEKQTDESPSDFLTVQNSSGREFVVRPASDKEVKKLTGKKEFEDIINMAGLAYVFAGKTGMICELISEEVIKSTEAENLDNTLELIRNLYGVF